MPDIDRVLPDYIENIEQAMDACATAGTPAPRWIRDRWDAADAMRRSRLTMPDIDRVRVLPEAPKRLGFVILVPKFDDASPSWWDGEIFPTEAAASGSEAFGEAVTEKLEPFLAVLYPVDAPLPPVSDEPGEHPDRLVTCGCVMGDCLDCRENDHQDDAADGDPDGMDDEDAEQAAITEAMMPLQAESLANRDAAERGGEGS